MHRIIVEVHNAMKLHYFNVGPEKYPNFGDDINPYLWSHFLPDFFDEVSSELFFGIGTILNRESLPEAKRYIVFGSGCGYGAPPSLDERWDVRFVRGPLTAYTLGLPFESAITDPAILVASLPGGAVGGQDAPAFMPHHWTAVHFGATLRRTCTRRGIRYLDPREEVPTTLEKLRRSRVLLAEAMHGAIVADALGIPWVPISVSSRILAFKWNDWCATHNLLYNPSRIASLRYSALPNPIRRLRLYVDATLIAVQLRRTLDHTTPILSDRAVSATLLERVENEVAKLRVGG